MVLSSYPLALMLVGDAPITTDTGGPGVKAISVELEIPSALAVIVTGSVN